MELPDFVVCPETLGPLEPTDGGYRSPKAKRDYPLDNQLLFLGYPKQDQSMISETMAEERAWQGVGDEVAARNLEFLKVSAPRAVKFINQVMPYVRAEEERPRAVELGSGNGWVSWLLAAAGFETWMCDFEPNSLVTGLGLQHKNLEAPRFVTDARYAPLKTGSMDLVVLKEFAHHVADYPLLFREANRVLRDDGVLALIEPVRSVLSTVAEIVRPDPHEGHHITWPDSYFSALRKAGFRIEVQAPVYDDYGERPSDRLLPGWIAKRAVAPVDQTNPEGNWFTWLHLRLVGRVQIVVVGRKVLSLPVAPRPHMVQIEPLSRSLSRSESAVYDEFQPVLESAARELDSSKWRT